MEKTLLRSIEDLDKLENSFKEGNFRFTNNGPRLFYPEPEQYPCVVVHEVEVFDNGRDEHYMQFEYVYQKNFDGIEVGSVVQ